MSVSEHWKISSSLLALYTEIPFSSLHLVHVPEENVEKKSNNVFQITICIKKELDSFFSLFWCEFIANAVGSLDPFSRFFPTGVWYRIYTWLWNKAAFDCWKYIPFASFFSVGIMWHILRTVLARNEIKMKLVVTGRKVCSNLERSSIIFQNI